MEEDIEGREHRRGVNVRAPSNVQPSSIRPLSRKTRDRGTCARMAYLLEVTKRRSNALYNLTGTTTHAAGARRCARFDARAGALSALFQPHDVYLPLRTKDGLSEI